MKVQVLSVLFIAFASSHALGAAHSPSSGHHDGKVIEAVSSPAEAVCPIGYVLAGKHSCIKEETVPPVKTCPHGFIKGNGKECSKKLIADRLSKCPEGFSPAHDGKCTRTNEVERVFFCPKGFTDTGKECSRQELVAMESHKHSKLEACELERFCPKGFEQGGKGQCVKTVVKPKQAIHRSKMEQCQVEFFCPKGTTERGKECVRQVVAEKEHRDVPKTEQCALDFVCPHGFEMSKGSKAKCVRRVTTPKSVKHQKLTVACESVTRCPAGFQMAGKGCTRTVETAKQAKHVPFQEACQPVAKCPHGMNMQGKICVSVEEVEKEAHTTKTKKSVAPVKHCQPVPSKDKSTKGQEHCTETCPKGTQMHGKECVMEETHTEFHCPHGFEQQGKTCIKTHEVPVELQCPHGCHESDHHDDKGKGGMQCFKESHTVEYECPKGFTLSGKVCVTQEHADLEHFCPKGCHEADHHEEKGKGKGGLQCEREDKHDETFCEKGWTEIGKECVKEEFAEAVPVCPHGCGEGHHEEKGKGMECTRTTHFTESFCPKGFTEAGKECVKEVAVEKLSQCPKGCTESHGHHDSKSACEKEVTWTEHKCPKGTTEAGKDCLMTVSAPEETQCPKGCEPQDHGHHDDGKGMACAKTVVWTTKSCPKGFVAEGKECVRQVPAAKESMCPKGTEEDHGKCLVFESKPMVTFCPKGFNDSDKGCTKIETAHAEESCAGHYEFVKGVCKFTVKVPATLTCPKGTELQHDECVSYHKKVVPPPAKKEAPPAKKNLRA